MLGDRRFVIGVTSFLLTACWKSPKLGIILNRPENLPYHCIERFTVDWLQDYRQQLKAANDPRLHQNKQLHLGIHLQTIKVAIESIDNPTFTSIEPNQITLKFPSSQRQTEIIDDGLGYTIIYKNANQVESDRVQLIYNIPFHCQLQEIYDSKR